MQLDAILEKRLTKRHELSDPEWSVWEHKTFNMHRCVLVWEPSSIPLRYSMFSEIVRAKIASLFKVSWWRGMGFGLIAIMSAEPEGIESCVDDIDTRDNPQGTWQWSIVHLTQRRTVIGAHMWAHGYLTPTFQQVIQAYESDGNTTATFKKEKDKLLKFLTFAMERRLKPSEYTKQ